MKKADEHTKELILKWLNEKERTKEEIANRMAIIALEVSTQTIKEIERTIKTAFFLAELSKDE